MSRERIIKLGETENFKYFGIQPPLTETELKDLPLPEVGESKLKWTPDGVETFDDGSMDIGFNQDIFAMSRESFVEYATRVAEYLGDCALDTEVIEIGPGSVISQANGALPNW